MTGENLTPHFASEQDPRWRSDKIASQAAEIAELRNKMTTQESQLIALQQQNGKLVDQVKKDRDYIATQKEEIDRLAQPPSSFATLMELNEDGNADVLSSGRLMRVAVSPSVELTEKNFGQNLILNEALNVVGVGRYPDTGEVMTVKELIKKEDNESGESDSHDRVRVTDHADGEKIVRLAGSLAVDGLVIKSGDELRVDTRSGFAFEKRSKTEVNELHLEKVPDINYGDIGGLDSQVTIIRKAVERPYLRPDLYAKYNRRTPKGVLLYGPPGCGKTMVAKAVAHNLAIKAKEKGKGDGNAYFLNIKGPELLNKYVGETERHIRLVFQKAREKAVETGSPVIIFFDEMESMFRARGSGISSDVESTIVPQILAEMDGAAEGMENIIVIGASNRQDLIDPALLRNGRLDARIKIDRPNEKAALDIFSKHLTPETPIHKNQIEKNGGSAEKTVEAMIASTVKQMYAETPANKFLEVTFANSEKGVLYFKDFISGAMIEGIVNRARDMAIDAEDAGQEGGITPEYLRQAVIDEYKENEDLPNTTNPGDWTELSSKGIKETDKEGKVRIKGRGQRVVHVRTVAGDDESEPEARAIDKVSGTGQYL